MIDIYTFLSFQVHGSAAGHKAGDGVAGKVEALLEFLEKLLTLAPTEIFAAVLPGVSGIANIHPLVVHFPIALLVSFFFADLFGVLFRKEGLRMLAKGLLYLGTLGALVTVIAGVMAGSTVSHGDNVHEMLEWHKMVGFSILGLSFILSIWRYAAGGLVKGFFYLPYSILSALLIVLVIWGADLGGMMVYKFGVAVDPVEVKVVDYFHEHTHSH